WAETHERGPALFTELSSFMVLKATAWAAHAASLLLWAPRGKEKDDSPTGGALLPVSGPLGGKVSAALGGPLHCPASVPGAGSPARGGRRAPFRPSLQSPPLESGGEGLSPPLPMPRGLFRAGGQVLRFL